jgi:hypothetical protein
MKQHSVKAPITVKPEFRSHPLSQIPGGSTVTVTKRDGTVLEYTDVKYPQKYFAKMNLKDVTKVQIGSTVVYEYSSKDRPTGTKFSELPF